MDKKNELKVLNKCAENNDCDEFFSCYKNLIMKVAHLLVKKFNVKLKNEENLIMEMYHEVVVGILEKDRKVLTDFDVSKDNKISTYIYGVAFNVIYNKIIKYLNLKPEPKPKNKEKKEEGKVIDSGKECKVGYWEHPWQNLRS